MTFDSSKILVTGGTGLLGSAFKRLLPEALFPTRQELDLQSEKKTREYIGDNKLSAVIHLAAMVGGVKANMEYVHDFYQANSKMNNNIVSSCVSLKVPKLVGCLSTCVYPIQDHVQYPLTEDQLHAGPPHSSNYGYAYAKRMLEVQIRSAREQYGLGYISVIPNNLYGQGDNFDLENSHVIPALIRKIWEAKLGNESSFEVWGDGEVYREFTHSDDMARAILFCLERYSDSSPINIGNPREYLLKDIIYMIKQILEYSGSIVFDSSKPKGQIKKPSSNQRFLDLGWDNDWYTPIEKGLKNTCEWFKINYPHNIRGV